MLSTNKTHISSFFAKTKDATATADSQDSVTIDDTENNRKRKSATSIENHQTDDETPIDQTKDERKSANKINSRTQTIARKLPKMDATQIAKSETITNFFSNDKDDTLEDFQINTKTIPKAKVIKRAVKKKPTSRKKQPDIRKCLQKPTSDDVFNQLITEHSAMDQVDPDQLQLALAISRSLADDEASNSSQAAAQQKTDGTSMSVKETIEKFSFKTIHGRPNDGDFADFFGAKKQTARGKKWKNRCTPLTRRADDVQTEKIQKKVHDLLLEVLSYESKCRQRILSEATGYEVTSTVLQRVCIPERPLFAANAFELDTSKNLNIYYTNNLVSPSKCKAGALLKDWASIPGRDSLFDCVPFSVKRIRDIEDIDEGGAAMETDDVELMDEHVNSDKILSTPEFPSSTPTDQHFTEANGFINIAEDGESTILMNDEDIQMKLDVINMQVQDNELLNSSTELTNIVHGNEDSNSLLFRREPSPDMFADCDIDDDFNTDSESSMYYRL